MSKLSIPLILGGALFLKGGYTFPEGGTLFLKGGYTFPEGGYSFFLKGRYSLLKGSIFICFS